MLRCTSGKVWLTVFSDHLTSTWVMWFPNISDLESDFQTSSDLESDLWWFCELVFLSGPDILLGVKSEIGCFSVAPGPYPVNLFCRVTIFIILIHPTTTWT